MKIITILLVGLFTYSSCFSQRFIDCDCSSIEKREFIRPINEKERKLHIAIICRLDYEIVIIVNKKITALWGYIQKQQDKKKKASMDSIINFITDYKRALSSVKQLKETMILDKYIYCYFDFLLSIYKKNKYIIEKYDLEEGIDKLKINFIYNEKEEEERNTEIRNTIKTILEENGIK